MEQFERHFKMEESDAADYAKAKGFFGSDAVLTCREIGDGNINYIFRVEDKADGRSVIIKHADVRIRSSGSLADTDRNRIEAEILKLEGKLAPGTVPEVYLYDPVMCCMVMEDLKDYQNMRYALIEHHVFPGFADDITTFMARTLIATTDNIMSPETKKVQVKNFINPALCSITENLVYTAPYTNHQGTNQLNRDNEDFFIEELYEDKALHLEVAKLKDEFKTKAQSLIHGDLHTGSIFVKEGGTKVLDPEFACYGPAGYDVGNVVANLIFAWVNAETTMSQGVEKEEFQGWLEKAIAEVVDLFAVKAHSILREETTDLMAQTEGFSEWFIRGILSDAAGVAGLELNRRIVGSAKVRDIAQIADSEQKARAERICVLAAKQFIMNRSSAYFSGRNYIETLKRVRDGNKKEGID